jgi:hypothetical protein
MLVFEIEMCVDYCKTKQLHGLCQNFVFIYLFTEVFTLKIHSYLIALSYGNYFIYSVTEFSSLIIAIPNIMDFQFDLR